MAISTEGREFVHAVRSGDVNAAKLIFRLHGDALLVEPSGGGAVALRVAAQRGAQNMVTFLLAAGIPASARDGEGRTAADHARAAGYDQLASLLDAAPSPTRARPAARPARSPVRYDDGARSARSPESAGAASARAHYRANSPGAAPRATPARPSSAATPPRSGGGAARGGLAAAAAAAASPAEHARTAHHAAQAQRERLVAHTQRTMEVELGRLRAATSEFRRLREAIGDVRVQAAASAAAGRKSRAAAAGANGDGDGDGAAAQAAAARAQRPPPAAPAPRTVADELRAMRAQNELIQAARRQAVVVAAGGVVAGGGGGGSGVDSGSRAPRLRALPASPLPRSSPAAERAVDASPPPPPSARADAGERADAATAAAAIAAGRSGSGFAAPESTQPRSSGLGLDESARAATAAASAASAALRGARDTPPPALAQPRPPAASPQPQRTQPQPAQPPSASALQPALGKRERPLSARPATRGTRLAAALGANGAAVPTGVLARAASEAAAAEAELARRRALAAQGVEALAALPLPASDAALIDDDDDDDATAADADGLAAAAAAATAAAAARVSAGYEAPRALPAAPALSLSLTAVSSAAEPQAGAQALAASPSHGREQPSPSHGANARIDLAALTALTGAAPAVPRAAPPPLAALPWASPVDRARPAASAAQPLVAAAADADADADADAADAAADADVAEEIEGKENGNDDDDGERSNNASDGDDADADADDDAECSDVDGDGRGARHGAAGRADDDDDDDDGDDDDNGGGALDAIWERRQQAQQPLPPPQSTAPAAFAPPQPPAQDKAAAAAAAAVAADRRAPTAAQEAARAAARARRGGDDGGASGLASSVLSAAETVLAAHALLDAAALADAAELGYPPPPPPLAGPDLLEVLPPLAPAQRALLAQARVRESADGEAVLELGARLGAREPPPPPPGAPAALWPATLCLRVERAAAAPAGAGTAAAAAAPPAQLLLSARAHERASAAAAPPLRLGRAADSALRLCDERVSSTHLTLHAHQAGGGDGGGARPHGPDGWRWGVRDEGSSNGSLLCLSGLDAPPAPIGEGDQLILGNSRLLVSFETAADLAAATAAAAATGAAAGAGAGVKFLTPRATPRGAAEGEARTLLVLTLLATEEWGALRWALDAAGADGACVRVGRASYNEVTLPDLSVSSEHASLQFEAAAADGGGRAGWWLRDRGSSNGSYLRLSVPRQVSRLFALAPGHRLTAGSVAISVGRFASGAASAIGRRPTMEDAHAIIDSLALSGVDVGGHGGARRVAAAHADEGWRASLYGVYDGHAGSAAAHWLRARLSGAIAAQLRAAAGLGGAGGADGAGGAGGGGARKRAARRRRPLSLAHARGALERAFASVDAELLAHEGACESGSCAAVALVCGAHVLTAHVGDCRVVLWRDGVAVPLTSDHRAAAPFEKARIEARGGFVAFDRVVGQLAVARAFGDRSFKRLDVSGGGGAAPRIEELVSAVPDVACVRWLPGDFLLLACDGVWDVLSDQEAADMLVRAYTASASGGGGGNMQLAVEQLVHAVEHDRRSSDNITAIGVALN